MIDLICESCGKDLNGKAQDALTVDYQFPDGIVQVWACIPCVQAWTPEQLLARYQTRIKNGENAVYH